MIYSLSYPLISSHRVKREDCYYKGYTVQVTYKRDDNMLPNDPELLWPPIDADYAEAMEEWAAWYGGDATTLANLYASIVGNVTGSRFWARNTAEEKRVQLHVPLAADMCQMAGALLFGEPPSIFIPEASQPKDVDNSTVNLPDASSIQPTTGGANYEVKKNPEALQAQERMIEIMDKNGFENLLLEGAESNAALGGCFLKVDWDLTLVDYPIITLVQADAAVPEFKFRVLTAVTFWRRVGDTSGDTYYRHLERHELDAAGNGVILHGLYKGDSDKLGSPVSLSETAETAGLVPSFNTGIKGLLVRYVPNSRPNKRWRNMDVGLSDLSGSEGMLDALDEAYTGLMRDCRLGQGRMFIPEQYLEKSGDNFSFNVDREAYSTIDVDPMTENAEITMNQFDIRAEEYLQVIQDLIVRIVGVAGYSPQTFGLEVSGRGESGVALRVRERKSLTTTAKKSRFWKTAISDILELALIVDAVILKSGVTPFRPTVEFSDSIATDPVEVANTVNTLKQAEAASRYTIIKTVHPDWDDIDIAQEINRIANDKAAAQAQQAEFMIGQDRLIGTENPNQKAQRGTGRD